MARRIAILASAILIGHVLLAADVAAQRGGARFRSAGRQTPGPDLPAPFDSLPAAQAIELSRLGQLSVTWLGKTTPPADAGDPTRDLFGSYGEKGEELPDDEWGVIVLGALDAVQTRMLRELAIRRQAEMKDYIDLRMRLLSTLVQLRGTTKKDRTVDLAVRDLGTALGKLEGAVAFDEATTYVKLAETLSEKQQAILQRLRAEPEIFRTRDVRDRQRSRPRNNRDEATSLDERIHESLHDFAAKAGSFLTGTAAENTRHSPQRPDLLGGTKSYTPDYVTSFLKAASPTQHEKYLELLNSETAILCRMAEKRVQMAESLDLQKRSRSSNNSRLVALGGQFGEMEARLALLQVRAFEQIRSTLTTAQLAQVPQFSALDPVFFGVRE